VATVAVMFGCPRTMALHGGCRRRRRAGQEAIEDLEVNQFQKSYDAVKEIAEKALAEAAKGITMSTEQKDKTDER
jgi:hypothetical protein